MGRKDKILTTGFTQTRDREVFVWDSRNMTKPIKQLMFDASPGVLIPLYDADTDLVWMTGRGDSSIRTFEVVDDNSVLYELNPVVDKTPHRGFCLSPKLTCDVMTAEVGRVMKVTNNSIIPIGFSVPRKSYREFHADVFPDTAGPDPAITADDYFGGANAAPLLVKVQPPLNSDGEAPAVADNGAAPVAAAASPTTSATSSPSTATRGSPQPAVKPGSLAPGAKKGPVRPHSVSVSVAKGEELKLENPDDYYVPKDISIVRQSHFKHIFGRPANRVDCYDDLRILNDAMQTRTLRANKKWFACSWQGIGGRLAVFSFANDKGRVTPPVPRGQVVDPSKSAISTIEIGSALIDFDFNPFDNDLVVTGGENALIKVWRIPETGIKSLGKNMTDPVATIRGHQHKIVTTDFHPFANNLLFTTSGDFTGRFWDIETQQEHVKITGFSDLVTSVTWNHDASLVGTSCKDRKVRLFDPRAGSSPIFEFSDVGGTLGSRIEWMGQKDQICLVGFDKMSERRIQVVDFKKSGDKLTDQRVDASSGVLTPLYDPSTGVLLLWGKGETSIKFWELNDQAPFAHALTDYQTTVPQLGIAVAPRHDCNVRDVEIFKVLKLTQDCADPISFIVPRQRKEFFQDDIYPPIPARQAVCSASEWAAGSKAQPKLVDLKPSDMQRLSEAPKIVRVVKKFKQDEEEELDAEAIKNRLVDKFYQQMMDFKEEDELEKAPGDELEGVADDEWDD
jgi:coronin-7